MMYIPGCCPHRCEKLNCDCVLYYQGGECKLWKSQAPLWSPEEPQSKGTTLELWPSMETWLYPFEIYDQNQARGGPFTHRSVSSLWKRVLGMLVSKAAERSSINKRTILFLTSSHRMSLWTFSSAVTVLWPLRYAGCMVSFSSWLFKKSLNFDATTLSIT